MKRLGQHRHVVKAAGEAVGAVAAGKYEWNLAFAENVGRSEAVMSPQIDVENGRVDVGVARLRERLIQRADKADDVPSKVCQEILDHHGDHRFVFDDQDAAGGHGQLQ